MGSQKWLEQMKTHKNCKINYKLKLFMDKKGFENRVLCWKGDKNRKQFKQNAHSLWPSNSSYKIYPINILSHLTKDTLF